jgi:hypothetical protein
MFGNEVKEPIHLNGLIIVFHPLNFIMKATVLLLSLALVAGFCSCNRSQPRYLDLNTNEYITIKKDSTNGLWINSKTGQPVDLYVDTQTRDTISGQTGEVVNGKVQKTDDGNWVVKMDGDEYKAKSESENSAKVKMEGDEFKLKDGSYTVKQKDNGDVKIENGKTQVKIDGKTGERKVKKDKNITDKIKKIF